ncbi:MAG: Yip1 family protein [Cellulosilyticaceae bacterium]
MDITKMYKALKYPLYVMLRPFDGFWDLKHEKKGNFKVAVLLVFAAMLTRILSQQYMGFLMQEQNPESFNVFIACCSILLPFLLWCSANWCLTTLMDGKGTFKDIFIYTAYALTPMILLDLPAIVLSHVVVIEEEVFCTFLLGVGTVWFVVLLVVGTMCTHHYSMSKTILTCLLTIVGIGVMIFIMLLFFNLIEQMMMFVTTLYKEIVFRL